MKNHNHFLESLINKFTSKKEKSKPDISNQDAIKLKKLCAAPSRKQSFMEDLFSVSLGVFIIIFNLSPWLMLYFDINKSIYFTIIAFISIICGIWYGVYNMRNY